VYTFNSFGLAHPQTSNSCITAHPSYPVAVDLRKSNFQIADVQIP
jgi:hypothetical protein